MSLLLNNEKYTIRREIFTIGGKFRIYNQEGELALYCKQKAFKLKEDIRLFSDESMTEEIITISARNVIDFQAAYDVIDTIENVKVGALQRKGMKSIFRDEWVILDEYDHEIGIIKEDSGGMAFLRRFLSNLIPQNFDAIVGGEKVVDLKQHFNPFIYKMDIDFSFDRNNVLDRRLGVAAGVLIAAIEGRQN